MADSLTYTHKGVTIEFSAERARFSAMVPGKRLTAPSLDAIKKQIDQIDAFKPFSALISIGLRWKEPSEKAIVTGLAESPFCLVRRQIVAMEKDPRREMFRDDNGKTHYTVIADTPEAIAAWVALDEAEHRKSERVAQLDAEIATAKAKVPYVRASEHAEKDL